MKCMDLMTPAAALRCERKQGHKGKHRRTVESADATTVFEWTRTWRS
jgi:hypothetical protein